jgi:hypothetical protein
LVLFFQRERTARRHQHFTVIFLRGGVINCPTAEEAVTIAARHCERARIHGVEERVLSAIAYIPIESP